MAFIVDKAKHTYHLDGEKLDSVTDMMIGLGIIDPTYYTVSGRIRGSKVHLGCELLEKPGGLDWESLKPIEAALGEPIEPFVRGYERFLKETGWVSTEIEKPGYSRQWKYAGTKDREGYFPGDKLKSILDIKTGKSVHVGTAIQTAAYDEMEKKEGDEPRRRYAIALPGNGDYDIKPWTDHNDGQTFLSSLPMYRWRKKNGLIRRIVDS